MYWRTIQTALLLTTSSMMSVAHAARQIALVVLLAGTSVVFSQDSDVTTCIPDNVWTINSRGQTPCLVASYLETACGQPIQVNAIPAGNHYLGPAVGQTTACMCSTVVYSLASACGLCQGRLWSNWTTWSFNCPTVSIGSPFPLPIPSGVEVPAWAYIDVRNLASQSFDPVSASAVAAASPTSTSASTLSSSTESSPPTGSPNASTHTNAGAIAGGVVGGIIGLAAIGLLIFWLMLRKRKARPQDPNLDFEKPQEEVIPQTHNRQGSQVPMLNSFSPPSMMSPLPHSYTGSATPPSFYQPTTFEPSEMGGMPMSPSSAVYTTLPSRRSFESVTSPQPSHSQFGSLITHPVGYTGAAELS